MIEHFFLDTDSRHRRSSQGSCNLLPVRAQDNRQHNRQRKRLYQSVLAILVCITEPAAARDCLRRLN